MKKGVFYIGWVFIFTGVTAQVQTASLTGLRFGQHLDRTRIVLDFLGTPSEYSIQEEEDSVEILVKNSRTTKPGPWSFTDVRIKEISLSSEGGTTRVLITLKKPVEVKSFTLQQPYRIVLDITDKSVEETSAPAHLLNIERVSIEERERFVLTFDHIPPYTYSEDTAIGSLSLYFQDTEMPAEEVQKKWKEAFQFSSVTDGLRVEMNWRGKKMEKILPLPQEGKLILNFQKTEEPSDAGSSEKPAEESPVTRPEEAPSTLPSAPPPLEPQKVILYQSTEEILREVAAEVKGEESSILLEFSQPVNFIARNQPPVFRLVFLDLYLPEIPEPAMRFPGLESISVSSLPSGSRLTLTLIESYKAILQAQTMKIILKIKREEIH